MNRPEPGDGEPLADALVLDDVLVVAARAGLVISRDDAKRLIRGARRVRAMAAEVRLLASPDVEPSGPALAPWPARSR